MMVYVGLAIGAIFGGLARFSLSVAIPNVNHWPMAILVINLSGSLVLGWFYGVGGRRSMPAWLRVGFGTGLIGSYTTFSTFSLNIVQLLPQHAWVAVFYALVSLIGGPFLAYLGDFLATLPARRAVETADSEQAGVGR